MTNTEEKPEPEVQKSDRASKLMDDMIKGLRDFGSAALEKAEEYGKIATEKAEELTKQGKTKLDIHQLNRSRSKELAALGELVFNLQAEDKVADLATHENYIVLIKTITDLDIEINEKAAQADQGASEADEAELVE